MKWFRFWRRRLLVETRMAHEILQKLREMRLETRDDPILVDLVDVNTWTIALLLDEVHGGRMKDRFKREHHRWLWLTSELKERT